ncbi:hypothetical protein [Xylocopilactobacillus apis]|uniref:Uncharacterized protein n=1 Tax=Xylocopilactobacillus apis TaxID=2932183 RepID=A0AAU9D3B1_9LACO|nr:hypothetical protein [Xylocopilactobacillus apis]BDR56780.1 hypothetical protein KIMC2_13420 [Xylocopilactobacillus apis]
MTEKNSSDKKHLSKSSSSTIKMLSWLIVGLCLIFVIIGFTLHKNVYMPILVMVLVSTVSLYNLERDDLKKSDYYNLYLAAALDVIALVLYFLQSMGKL